MDSINTKDIMEIAGGARSNFYNYFSDKFDLCNAIMQDELKVTERLLNSFFRENDKLINEESVLALNMIRFDHIYESRELYKALFTAECFRGFPEMLRETMEKGLSYRFQMIMGENTKIPEFRLPVLYDVHAFCKHSRVLGADRFQSDTGTSLSGVYAVLHAPFHLGSYRSVIDLKDR